MKSIKNLISLGYLLMALLVIGIMYIWRKEWYELEKLEVQNRHIDTFRQESHEIFVLLIELSLSGESVLEWDDKDLEHYHTYISLCEGKKYIIWRNHGIFLTVWRNQTALDWGYE